MDHLGLPRVTMQWSDAVDAVVEVGNAVAALRGTLSAAIREDRLEAQARADMFAHRLLIERLAAMDPDVPVVSEEDSGHIEKRPSTYWLIDPIDGTASWSGGFDGFVCQIARIVGGIATFGVIHAPALGLTWRAERGQGAFLNDERLERLPAHSPEDRQLVVVDNYPQARGVAKDLSDWLGNTIYRESGSIGLKAALVASGLADIFIKDVVVRDWDIAPALAITREVGGFARLINGGEYPISGSYDKPDGVLFACNEQLGESVLHWWSERTN